MSKRSSSLARLDKRLRAQIQENIAPSSGSMAENAIAAGAAILGSYQTNQADEAPPDTPKYVNQNIHDRLRETTFLSSAPNAKALLQSLRDRADRESKLTYADVDEQLQLQQERAERFAQLRKLTDHQYAARYGSEVVPHDHPSAVQARALLAETDKKRADHERRAAEHKRSRVGALLTKIEQELEKHRSHSWHDIEPINVAFDEELHAKTIQKIKRLNAEIERVRSAPPSASEVKASITAQIDALAAKGKPSVSANGKLSLPIADAPAPSGVVVSREQIMQSIPTSNSKVPDGVAYTTWLHRLPILP